MDASYTSAELMVSSRRDFGVTPLGPCHLPARCDQHDRFGLNARGRESIVVRFPVTACQPCPVHPQCTRSTRKARQVMQRPEDVHNTVEQARTEQTTEEWSDVMRSGRPSRAPSTKPLPAVTGSAAIPATQDTPCSHPRRHRAQPDPPGRTLDRNSPAPASHQPPHQTRPGACRIDE